jgi:hypothetical protein
MCQVWDSLFLSTAPSLGYHQSLCARSNGCLIFSQEKLIFFEQIQPLDVIRYPSISFTLSKLQKSPSCYELFVAR